jgi:hypothetical protein
MRIYELIECLAGQAELLDLKIVVARNYESLPVNLASADIDLIIARDDIVKWSECIERTSMTLGLDCNMASQYYYCRQYAVMGLDDGPVRFDLLPILIWRGVKWGNTESVIAESIKYKDFIFKPKPIHEALITFCHSYLYGGFVKSKYVNHLQELIGQDFDGFELLLNNIFGERIGRDIFSELNLGDVSKLDQFSKKRRIFLALRHGILHPMIFYSSLLKDIIFELNIKNEDRLLSESSKRIVKT